MSDPRYVVAFNGTDNSLLHSFSGLSEQDELARLLGLLDGGEDYSLVLWKLPDGEDFADVDLDRSGDAYIQCAGAFTDRLTCEIRTDGRQFVLGRGAEPAPAPEEVVIPWNGSQTVVRADEALTGDEATEVFVSYLHTGAEPAGYHRRGIRLA